MNKQNCYSTVRRKSTNGPQLTGTFRVYTATGQQMMISWLDGNGNPTTWTQVGRGSTQIYHPRTTYLTHWFQVKLTYGRGQGSRCAYFQPKNNVTLTVR